MNPSFNLLNDIKPANPCWWLGIFNPHGIETVGSYGPLIQQSRDSLRAACLPRDTPRPDHRNVSNDHPGWSMVNVWLVYPHNGQQRVTWCRVTWTSWICGRIQYKTTHDDDLVRNYPWWYFFKTAHDDLPKISAHHQLPMHRLTLAPARTGPARGSRSYHRWKEWQTTRKSHHPGVEIQPHIYSMPTRVISQVITWPKIVLKTNHLLPADVPTAGGHLIKHLKLIRSTSQEWLTLLVDQPDPSSDHPRWRSLNLAIGRRVIRISTAEKLKVSVQNESQLLYF